jgi:uncharacterized membrane protein
VFTTIDEPNAGTAPGQGTSPEGINASGVIAGFYEDANSVQHGFLLRDGVFTTIDDPAGVLGSAALGLNDHGQVSGVYVDAGGVAHGYVLSGGQFTTIDPPGAVDGAADAINDAGTVVGVYIDASGIPHSYGATPAHGNSDVANSILANDQASTAVAPSKTDQPPTVSDVAQVDQVFAEHHQSAQHPWFMHPRARSASLPLDWLNDE